MLAVVRRFFDQRGVMEVETPILSQYATTDPNIESFCCEFVGPGAGQGSTRYLHTSPEFAMKRLLCAGSGPIYQVCKVFRQGECGDLHNPEFTLLEWYRPGFSQEQLLDEIEQLLRLLMADAVDLQATETLSYQQVFQRFLGIDPLQASAEDLMACAQQQNIDVHGLAGSEPDAWLDLLMSYCIQPQLGKQRITFLVDYPASQAALARLNPQDERLAKRFEVFVNGVEIGNGFEELSDSDEQRRRFQQDLVLRQQRQQIQVPEDQRLLAALEHGLPECSGVAIGLDRVLLLILGEKQLSAAIAFPFATS